MARIARLGVVIDSSGAKRGADETTTALRGIEKTAERTVSQLQKAAATLGIAFGVKALQESVDQYTLLDARLKQVTGSGAAYARVQQQLFSIAQASRASFSATVANAPDLLAKSTHSTSVSLYGMFSFVRTSLAASGFSNTTRMTPCSAESIMVIAVMLILALANSPRTRASTPGLLTMKTENCGAVYILFAFQCVIAPVLCLCCDTRGPSPPMPTGNGLLRIIRIMRGLHRSFNPIVTRTGCARSLVRLRMPVPCMPPSR